MLNKLRSLKHSDGFTIIEVIIVLVIAAVIMLMVFLVVPQLNRSQRNTRRQSAARQVLAAAEQWAANNGGTYPVQDGTGLTNLQTITGTLTAPSGSSYSWLTVPVAGTSGDPTNNNAIYYTWNTYSCNGGIPSVTTNSNKAVVIVANEGSSFSSNWCVSN